MRSEDLDYWESSPSLYEVYVDEEFVGQKLLLGQSDSVQDVDFFLIQNGFQPFTSELEGERYRIYPTQKEQAASMKEQLGIYLQVR